MAAATVQDIITRALRSLGYLSVSKVPTSAESAAAFQVLVELMQSLNRQHLWMYDETIVSLNTTASQSSYTWGVGGNITTPARPDKLQRASYLIGSGTGQTEIPMHVIKSMAEWQGWALKNLTSTYPTSAFYDPQYPLGLLYLRPIPTGILATRLYVWTKVTEYAALSDTIALPDGYQRALRLMLIVEMGPEFNMDITPQMQQRADDALGLIKSANTVPRPIGCDVNAVGGSGYNILADDASGRVIQAP